MKGMIAQVLQAFVTLLVIMDPFVSLPVLIAMTKGCPEKHRKAMADRATLIAGVIMLIFYVSSLNIFELIGISLASFMVAGGIVLLILGVQGALGISFRQSRQSKDVHVAAVIIGTPLITGPGTITTIIVLVQQLGYLVAGIAGILALAVTWIVLRQANLLYRHLGERTIEVFSRVMGLLVTAIAIEFISKGIRLMASHLI